METGRRRINYGGMFAGLLCVALGIFLGAATMRVLMAYMLVGGDDYPPQVVRGLHREVSQVRLNNPARTPEPRLIAREGGARGISYGLAALSGRALASTSGVFSETEVYARDSVAKMPDERIPPGPFRTGATAPIFDDGLTPGWDDWSWSVEREHVAGSDAPAGERLLEARFLAPWAGLYFHTAGFAPYVNDVLALSIRTDDETPPILSVEFFEQPGQGLGAVALASYVAGGVLSRGVWEEARIPLADLRAAWGTTTGFAIVSDSRASVMLDQIYITPGIGSTRFLPMPPSPVQPVLLADVFGAPSLYRAAPAWSDWKSAYGEHRFEDGVLRIETKQPETATLIELVGSGHWRDYETAMRLNWHRGASTIETIVRFADERNYLACAWNLHSTHLHAEIRNIHDGEMSQVSSWSGALPLPYFESWRDIEIGVRVVGDSIACLHNGEAVLSGTILADAPLPERGGIALKTWEPEAGYTILAIEDVEVFEAR
ncbi:MAG: hypothetical protein Q8R39_04880 [bacterium]|nr:hypothetical protein [bacterium]MDZ4284930.1 hypothetical protein [Patescibacteria group bacterium]